MSITINCVSKAIHNVVQCAQFGCLFVARWLLAWFGYLGVVCVDSIYYLGGGRVCDGGKYTHLAYHNNV